MKEKLKRALDAAFGVFVLYCIAFTVVYKLVAIVEWLLP